MCINMSADRRAALNKVIEDARKQIDALNAKMKAEQQLQLQNASPEEKMRMKRASIIEEKRRNDADYQMASRRIDRLHKQRKDADIEKWRMKRRIKNHYENIDLDLIEEEYREAYKLLQEASARIEREADEEVNAGDLLCC